MRRMVSLFVSAALLVVSSVPLVSAVACEMPAHAEAAMHDEALHRHDMPMHAPAMHHDMAMGHAEHDSRTVSDTMAKAVDLHAGHDHSAFLSGDWQSCRIECGCGCHRSIDSLPHLLAPHSADAGFQPVVMASERATPVVTARLPARERSVTSPPPDSI